MSTHYTFCPKCELRHGTSLVEAKAGIQCECGTKFWPEKITRSDPTASSWSSFGMFLGIGGLIIFVWSAVFEMPVGVELGAGACGAGFWCMMMGQLFHIRSALEKLNNKKL